MEEFLPKDLHIEFEKRIGGEFNRINHRLKELEGSVAALHTLTISVERLATNMEGMLKEMEAQGRRLTILEGRDGEKWRAVVACVITAIVGVVIGVFVKNG